MSQLPTPSAARPPSEIDPWDLWRDVVVQVKKRIAQPSFWQAVEMVIPIAIEGATFVVGLPAAAGHYSSHLTGSENRRRLEVIIQEIAGIPLTLRMIEGTDESDWEDVKRRDQAVQNAQAAFRTRLDSPLTARALTWESLQERIYGMFSRAQGHHLPQGRVRYLLQVLPILADGSRKIKEASPGDDEKNERALARIIDKVAGLVEMPSASVALELLRHQEGERPTSPPGPLP